MTLPVAYIVNYEPIIYSDTSYEASLRHIAAYAKLLKDIEDTSLEFANMLNKLREPVPASLLDYYYQSNDDSLFYCDMCRERSSKEVAEYAVKMAMHAHEHFRRAEQLILEAVDKQQLEHCYNTYLRLVDLLDEKYHDHDRWYHD